MTDGLAENGLVPGGVDEATRRLGRAAGEVGLAAATLTTASAALTEAVVAARLAGIPWAVIGRETGMTRQSAHERWSSEATAAGAPPSTRADGHDQS